MVCISFSCNNSRDRASAEKIASEKQSEVAIIIHGGAGTILRGNLSKKKEKAYRNKLEEAIKKGHTILKTGGTSQLAVVKTIQVMEASPLFNAGKGAVFIHEETNELDAFFMNGETLNAGAVAGVKNVTSSIELVVKIMTDSEHVMLSGEGASIFAKEKGLEMVDPAYFYTERRFKSLQRIKNRSKTELDNDDKKAAFYDTDIKNAKFGTVGCVSSAGWGEYFIRSQVAYDISAQMEYQKKTLKEATKDVIQNKLTKLGGTGGVVALDNKGNMSFEFNTAGMYRASMNDAGELVLKIYKE
jgi:beta-aspartyl-peptidase (threonine type)